MLEKNLGLGRESIKLKTAEELVALEQDAKGNYLKAHIAEYGDNSLPATLAFDMLRDNGGYPLTVLRNSSKFKDLKVIDLLKSAVIDNRGSHIGLSIGEYWEATPIQYRKELRTLILDNGLFFASTEQEAIEIAGDKSTLGSLINEMAVHANKEGKQSYTMASLKNTIKYSGENVLNESVFQRLLSNNSVAFLKENARKFTLEVQEKINQLPEPKE